MKTYVVHYKKLKERRSYLESMINELVFIDEFERDNYNSDIKYQSGLWRKRVKYSTTPAYVPTFKELKHSEICNALSHMKAMQNLLDSDEKYTLIIEDDSVITDTFKTDVSNIKLPEGFDFIFLGKAYNPQMLERIHLVKSTMVSDGLYKKSPGTTRTVDSYIVSRKGAKKCLNELENKISMPFDHELNFVFKKNPDMDIYWTQPGLVEQGTKNGKYKSSIR